MFEEWAQMISALSGQLIGAQSLKPEELEHDSDDREKQCRCHHLNQMKSGAPEAVVEDCWRLLKVVGGWELHVCEFPVWICVHILPEVLGYPTYNLHSILSGDPPEDVRQEELAFRLLKWFERVFKRRVLNGWDASIISCRMSLAIKLSWIHQSRIICSQQASQRFFFGFCGFLLFCHVLPIFALSARHNPKLWLQPFLIIATTHDGGLLEVVTNAISISELKKTYGSSWISLRRWTHWDHLGPMGVGYPWPWIWMDLVWIFWNWAETQRLII